MYEEFLAERLSKLRQIKDISARDMSLSIGQNANYINQIENRNALPSMQVFFYICEYLGVTPQEFFDTENVCPQLTNELINDLKVLNHEILGYITGIVKELNKK